jgi:hypothetical protein
MHKASSDLQPSQALSRSAVATVPVPNGLRHMAHKAEQGRLAAQVKEGAVRGLGQRARAAVAIPRQKKASIDKGAATCTGGWGTAAAANLRWSLDTAPCRCRQCRGW